LPFIIWNFCWACWLDSRLHLLLLRHLLLNLLLNLYSLLLMRLLYCNVWLLML
jgi:hypothetical protein